MDSRNTIVQRLRDWIEESQNIVFFTGAGISTESGIPDYRSPGGIWTQYRPIEFSDFMASEEIRREAWHRKFAIDKAFARARPNRGHRAIAKLIQDGKASAVITQNIDNLHQVSGIDPDKVIELHGNNTYAKCLKCGERYELMPIRIAFERDSKPPYCQRCQGIIKTAVISYGQPMPVNQMRRAENAALAADLFFALGSSLTVYPAAGFPALAKRNGSRLVIINRDPTNQDSLADVVFHAEIGLTLGEIVGVE